MNKQKIQKVQSPINNYKRFLTQNSDSKNLNSHHMLKPQIIQRPKIQNYLTQNLPSKNSTYGERSERKEKNS